MCVCVCLVVHSNALAAIAIWGLFCAYSGNAKRHCPLVDTGFLGGELGYGGALAGSFRPIGSGTPPQIEAFTENVGTTLHSKKTRRIYFQLICHLHSGTYCLRFVPGM